MTAMLVTLWSPATVAPTISSPPASRNAPLQVVAAFLPPVSAVQTALSQPACLPVVVFSSDVNTYVSPGENDDWSFTIFGGVSTAMWNELLISTRCNVVTMPGSTGFDDAAAAVAADARRPQPRRRQRLPT